MSVGALIKSEVRNVATILVNGVIENIDGLYTLRAESEEHHKDGVDEEISMELDRLMFHNVRLNIPGMPNKGLTKLVQAASKRLWTKEVNRLLDLHDSQDPEYPISFRL